MFSLQLGEPLLPHVSRGLPEPADCLDRLLCNRYLVEALCDETAGSSLYRAYHLGLDRQVLLEVLPRRALQPANVLEPVRALALGVRSRHLCCLEVASLKQQWPILVHEFRAGSSVSSHMRSFGQMSVQRVFPLAERLAMAVASMRASGCYHGQLSLDRIWLEESQGPFEDLMILGLGARLLPPSRFPRARSGVFERRSALPATQVTAVSEPMGDDVASMRRCVHEMATGEAWRPEAVAEFPVRRRATVRMAEPKVIVRQRLSA